MPEDRAISSSRVGPTLLPQFPEADVHMPGGRARSQGLQVAFLNLQFPNCPWLLMMLNPDTWSEQYAKRVTNYETRGAWVEEHWGHDELDTITASGYSMIYTYLVRTSDQSAYEGESLGALEAALAPSGRSVLREASDPTFGGEFRWLLASPGGRFDTPAGTNEQYLLQTFLNAGAIYNPKGQVDRFKGLLMVVGSDFYVGYLENIRFSEEAVNPWRRSFDFSFKVRFAQKERSVSNPAGEGDA